MNQPNRTYTIALIVIAFFYSLGVITMAFMSFSPTVPERTQWVFPMTAWMNGAFTAAMVTTLILRGVAPDAGRIATKALNIILLFSFPLGTVLGIYGLLKVDKQPDPV